MKQPIPEPCYLTLRCPPFPLFQEAPFPNLKDGPQNRALIISHESEQKRIDCDYGEKKAENDSQTGCVTPNEIPKEQKKGGECQHLKLNQNPIKICKMTQDENKKRKKKSDQIAYKKNSKKKIGVIDLKCVLPTAGSCSDMGKTSNGGKAGARR